MTSTTTTRAIPGITTFALAAKVNDAWTQSPTLFAEYKVTKSDFDTALTEAQTADAEVRAAKANLAAEKMRLQAIRAEVIAKANKDLTDGIAAAKERADAAVARRNATLTTLSRLSNGARYHAKSIALSDADMANDATGKRL